MPRLLVCAGVQVSLNWEYVWRLLLVLRLPTDLFVREGLQVTAREYRPIIASIL